MQPARAPNSDNIVASSTSLSINKLNNSNTSISKAKNKKKKTTQQSAPSNDLANDECLGSSMGVSDSNPLNTKPSGLEGQYNSLSSTLPPSTVSEVQVLNLDQPVRPNTLHVNDAAIPSTILDDVEDASAGAVSGISVESSSMKLQSVTDPAAIQNQAGGKKGISFMRRNSKASEFKDSVGTGNKASKDHGQSSSRRDPKVLKTAKMDNNETEQLQGK
jgi:hypothetical protein